jgi:hypothetical protein
MGVKELALEPKKWARLHRMMGDYPDSPPVDTDFIKTLFGKAGVPAATKVLQNKGISYIAVNEKANEILVFTNKKLTVREEKLLGSAGIWLDKVHVNIVFMHSDVLKVGDPPDPPVSIAPYTEKNGRYTCGSSVYIASEKGSRNPWLSRA